MGKILITGGLGFIGTNAALRYSARTENTVVLFDNLSRHSSRKNLPVLKGQTVFQYGDLRSFDDVCAVFSQWGPFDLILHLGAQTAVTHSITNPILDFKTNTLGTVNLLEACRGYNPDAYLIYASTNKVYGEIPKYVAPIDETYPLDFYSPYGASKGAADQYVREYCRTYNLKTLVARQSCIYGPYQWADESQGWIAWLAMATLLGERINVYGDGEQRRDILYVDDLIDFYDLAFRNQATGIYNVGGGKQNVISINGYLNKLSWMLDINLNKRIAHKEKRLGDQTIYISDISKAAAGLGWQPKTDIDAGIGNMLAFLRENEKELRQR